MPDQTVYEYLLQHKTGLTILARIRNVINLNYSLMGLLNDKEVYVSPSIYQWFTSGVMFLQGLERFTGLLGLYQDGQVKFAVCARDTKKGELLGPNDFLFVDAADAEKSQELSSPEQLSTAVSVLEQLLNGKEERESYYQDYLTNFPWSFGAQYTKIQSHESLDDQNIPDFSAVRVRDGSRDIFEIKSPFLNLFRANNEFAADFNDAWNQAERYLDFVRREADYLRRQKGLRFENPHCYLVLGKDLSEQQIEKIRSKERMNPAITIITYDDLLTLVHNTVKFIERLSNWNWQRKGLWEA